MKTKAKSKGGESVSIWVGPVAAEWLRAATEDTGGLVSVSGLLRSAAAAGLPLVAGKLVAEDKFANLPDRLDK